MRLRDRLPMLLAALVLMGGASCVTSLPAADDRPAAATATSPLPATAPAAAESSLAITNYRSGISLMIQGQNGKDYAVERFWHNAVQDDHGVIYIRSNVKLALEHNERNQVQGGSTAGPFQEIGKDGKDGKPNSGDEGVIRYLVDRDQSVGQGWSAKKSKLGNPPQFVCPAFAEPMAFDDLEYEAGAKVVGSIGAKPEAKLGAGFYYRGLRDRFGDEWHTLTVADDDSGLHDDRFPHKWASDGKVFLFVLNPTTPCLSLRARTGEAQYYTTPAKTYYLPRIHDQISYVVNGVDLVLINITNDQPLFYSLDKGEPRRYTTPLRSEDLAEGRHELEYWFEGGTHKTRVVVKNPPWPSASEAHPRLFWADNAELEGVRSRLKRPPYEAYYQNCRTIYHRQKEANRVLGRGSRTWVNAALVNALIAFFEGVEAKADGASQSYAAYAKRMLLDNKLSLDPIGIEQDANFAPAPTREWTLYGYYSVNQCFDVAFGYDLLIGCYRADRVTGGITAIEDLKIRDLLANWIAVQIHANLRGFEGRADEDRQPKAEPATGMWGFSRLCGAAVAAMAMPAYDTAYYGTSGFDLKTPATHKDLPFAGQAFTWKELLIDANQEEAETPRLSKRFDWLDGGLVSQEGQWFDRIPYYSQNEVGHCVQYLANTAKLTCGKGWPCLERSFEHAIAGTLKGGKVNQPSDREPTRYVQILLANPRFPDIAKRTREYLQQQKEQGTKKEGIGRLFNEAGPLALLWYQDDVTK